VGLASVTVAAPVRNPGLAVVGVAAMEVRGADVLFAANQAPVSPGGQILLVDPDGEVVAARDSRLLGRNLGDVGLGALVSAIAAEPAATLTGLNLDGRGAQVAAWNEAVPGLTSVVLQPRKVFMGPIDRLSNTTTVLFVLVGVVAIVAAALLARRLSRPVGVLTAAAGQVEAGEPVDDEALAVIGKSHDDVGRLARVFATMAEQVAARERKLRAQVRALKVEIDHERRRQAVEEVTDTEFFRDLQSRAAEMRARAKGPVASSETASSGTASGEAASSETAAGDPAAGDGTDQGDAP
jgi:methyl-accepting chemotaxis protein